MSFSTAQTRQAFVFLPTELEKGFVGQVRLENVFLASPPTRGDRAVEFFFEGVAVVTK